MKDILQKSLIVVVFVVMSLSNCCEAHLHSESSYQHAWSAEHNGEEEFINDDYTRVDCLTGTHAVEFDFANKWAESVGQALHYQNMTGKRAKVVLILENPAKEMKYFERVQRLAFLYDFDAEYITPEILPTQNGKCIYRDCKCHRKNQNNKKTQDNETRATN
ncbi:MAG: hypothetical protein K6C34_02350 [Alphaproteobacteria bacterium]|nr:hypothetical protein [Alphaproteobacteria bacterium]